MSAAETVRGTVKTLNFAPKGEIDALILEADGQTVQINLPPELGGHAQTLVGQELTVQTKPEPKVADHPKGAHPVFRLAAIVDADGKAVATPSHPHEPAPKGHDEPVEVAGTVHRLNYAKHGEANGVVLDTGDFVHLKPEGMKQVGLTVGQQVTARGKAKSAAAGGKAVEAETVNGVELEHKRPH